MIESKVLMSKIIFYYVLKYIVFYLFLMIKNDNYSLLYLSEIENGEDLFYYVWLILFLPLVNMALFGIPLFFSLKVSNLAHFLFLIGGILLAEYFVYTFLASTTDLMNGVYNVGISIIFLFLFFRESILKLNR